MSLSKLLDDLNIISSLDDKPNENTGMTAAQLKAKFDEGILKIKDFINNTLTEEMPVEFATHAELESLVLGEIPDGTITEAKLSFSVATQSELNESNTKRLYGVKW